MEISHQQMTCIKCGLPMANSKKEALKLIMTSILSNCIICPHCQARFTPAEANEFYTKKIATGEMPIEEPHNLLIQNDANGMSLTWNWNRGAGIVLTLFGLIWSILMSLGLPSALKQSTSAFSVNIFFVIPGVVLLYFGLCCLFNQTTLTVNKRSINISSQPLPGIGSKEIPDSDIDSFYYESHRSSGGKSGQSKPSYYLCARLKAGGNKTLAKVPTRDHSLFLANTLTSYLGLPAKNYFHV